MHEPNGNERDFDRGLVGILLDGSTWTLGDSYLHLVDHLGIKRYKDNYTPIACLQERIATGRGAAPASMAPIVFPYSLQGHL